MTFDEVEKAREAYYQKSKKNWTITLVTTVIIFGLGIFIIRFAAFPIAILALVIGAIITSFSTNPLATAYRKAYKAYFVEKNLKSIFTNLHYAHNEGMSKEFLRSTGMINTGDVYSSNDYTSGCYKNVNFSQADAHIQVEHTDSDGNTTYVTIFKGKFMVFEFPKKFNFKLELVGKRFSAYRVPGGNSANGRKMEKIKTESSEFNDSFRIYGEDGFEAYYILDPAFMVKILEISEQYKKRILFGFIDNKLLIGLSDGKDSLEPPKASKPIDEAAENQKVSAEIKVITDFVDQLSLARNIFK